MTYPRRLNLTRADQLEWFRYERASKRALEFYRHWRAWTDSCGPCLVCDERTYAANRIHLKCRETP